MTNTNGCVFRDMPAENFGLPSRRKNLWQRSRFTTTAAGEECFPLKYKRYSS